MIPKIELTDVLRQRVDNESTQATSKNWEFRCCIDPEKMKAYHAFLARVSKDKVIVDLGSSNGVMAYIALRHGAKKVICIDYNRDAPAIIEANLKEYYDEGKVEIYHRNAITDSMEIIKDADYIVHEIFGHSVHDELIVDISRNMAKHGLLDKMYPKIIEWYKVMDGPAKSSDRAVKYFKENYDNVVADFHELHSKRVEDLTIVHNTMPCLEKNHDDAEWINLGRTRLDNLDLMRFVPKALEEVKSMRNMKLHKEYFFTWKIYFDDTEQESYRGAGRQLSNWTYMPGPGGSQIRFIKAVRFGENINPHVSI